MFFKRAEKPAKKEITLDDAIGMSVRAFFVGDYREPAKDQFGKYISQSHYEDLMQQMEALRKYKKNARRAMRSLQAAYRFKIRSWESLIDKIQLERNSGIEARRERDLLRMQLRDLGVDPINDK